MILKALKGCLVLTPNTQVAFSAFTVECIDTTGAGDAFMSGFLAALAEYGLLKMNNIYQNSDASGCLWRFSYHSKGAIAGKS